MNSNTTKQLTVGVLAAVIVFTWGFAIYSYFNPVELLLDEEDLVEVKDMIETSCPQLNDEYQNRREPPNNGMRVDIAKELVMRCVVISTTGNDPAISPDPFYDALVQEFEKH